MTSGLLTTGRYQVLSGVTLPIPAQCAMCGEANRPTVTFSFNIPRYGAFLMCVECFKSCVRDLSPVLGFVPLEEFQALSERYSKELSENARYRDVFESVGPRILALVTEQLASAGISVDDSGVVSDSESVDEVQTAGEERFFLFDVEREPATDFFGSSSQSAEAD